MDNNNKKRSREVYEKTWQYKLKRAKRNAECLGIPEENIIRLDILIDAAPGYEQFDLVGPTVIESFAGFKHGSPAYQFVKTHIELKKHLKVNNHIKLVWQDISQTGTDDDSSAYLYFAIEGYENKLNGSHVFEVSMLTYISEEEKKKLTSME